MLTYSKLHCNSSRVKSDNSLSFRKSWNSIIFLVRGAEFGNDFLSGFDLAMVRFSSIGRITASSFDRFLFTTIVVSEVRVYWDKLSFFVRNRIKCRVDITLNRCSLRASFSRWLLIIRDCTSIHGSTDISRFASQVRSRSHFSNLVSIV